ncbi:hypothetical protein [Acinetobacter soli]|uniref:hypothetical protein n=1 Tax=Acinetobacter soli TaxID=487316 RepID=UPI000469675D|nr:hypothetical protein [Acinetobacter soli]
MRIVAPDKNTVVGFDPLVTAVLRSDCIPVPMTLEFQILINSDQRSQFVENAVVYLGNNYISMKIIKAVVMPSSIVRDDERLTLGSFIAVLEGCEKLIKPVTSATYLENTSINSILKASGLKNGVTKDDVAVLKYFVPLGETPTFIIAAKLAEEAAVMYANQQGRITVTRLNNLMNEGPKLKVDQTEVNWIGNTSALLHSTPNFITLNADGSTIEGDIQSGKAAKFIPSSDARRFKNMSTMLVTKGTFMRAMSPNIGAGDIIEINQRKYFILTAAHRFDTGALGGSIVSASKFWFAEVQSL